MDLILKNATIVTSAGTIQGDIGIEGGKIAAVGDFSSKSKSERDCTGLFVLPGAIDMHVHFRDPGFPEKEDFASGSRAAVAAGITTVIDMPNTDPPTLTVTALEEKRAIAAAKSSANYGFYMGFNGKNLDAIKSASNIAGVKVYTAHSTGNLGLDDFHLIEGLFELNMLTVVHAEMESIIEKNAAEYKGAKDASVHSRIRSVQSSYEAVKEVLHLAKKHEVRVHITHVSSEAELKELRAFKNPNVTADATPHHLFLNDNAYKNLKNFAKVNPPLRSQEDQKALWDAIHEGLLQAIATDHAPHTKEEKMRVYAKAPAGMPGVETMLPLLFDAVNKGELTLSDVALLTSTNPAKIIGIKNKGKIEVGYDADLAIVDMNKELIVGQRGYLSKSGWSPFEGMKLRGWPLMTIINGKIVYGNGVFNEGFRGTEIQTEI